MYCELCSENLLDVLCLSETDAGGEGGEAICVHGLVILVCLCNFNYLVFGREIIIKMKDT